MLRKCYESQEISGENVMHNHELYNEGKVKIKQSHYRPGQALRVPGGWGSQITRQSALRTGRLYPRKYSWYSFLLEAESTPEPEGLCQWKKSNDTIGNQTRDLPACSAVPEPTALSRAPILQWSHLKPADIKYFCQKENKLELVLQTVQTDTQRTTKPGLGYPHL
jgi:hypothetical protein